MVSSAHKVSRRSFVENALLGAGVLSIGSIAGRVGVVVAADKGAPTTGGTASTAAAAKDHSGHMAMAEDVSAGAVKHSAEDMDRMHREGLEAFMRNQKAPITEGKGNQPLQATDRERRQGFRLSVDEVSGRSSPARRSPARGYNGMRPGPDPARAPRATRSASSSPTS